MSSVRIYLDQIKLRLVVDPLVRSFDIVREREVIGAGYLRVRAVVANGDRLELAEYFEIGASGVRTVDYRHQWMAPDGTLRARWDSTPHFPDLPGFPHHLHDGSEDNVVPATPLSILAALDELTARIHPYHP